MSTMFYTWQHDVLDAFMASADRLLEKIEAAENFITQRLKEQPSADEKTALCNALMDLNVLRSQATEFAAPKRIVKVL